VKIGPQKSSVYSFKPLILRSYLTNYVHQIFYHIADEPFEIVCDIQLRFKMLRRRMKVNTPISPILTLKLVAMATYFKQSEKGSDQ